MKISVAIPDSSLIDESTKLEKTRKISVIARICSIFRINEIFIYHDGKSNDDDRILLSTILKYLETPQYFRKYLYPKTNLLKFAGVLYPLQIPSHSKIKDPKLIKPGDIREGIIINFKGKKFLDVGLNQFISYFGKKNVGTRVILKFKNGYPNFSVKEISKEQVDEYWGYRVLERANVFSLISSWEGNIILTSRKGEKIKRSSLKWIGESQKPTLVVFGSPQKGLHDFLGSEINKINNSKILNFFPQQGTQTVRLEEAMLGTLAVLNIPNLG